MTASLRHYRYDRTLGTYSAKLIAETLGGQISLDSSKENRVTIKINFSKNE